MKSYTVVLLSLLLSSLGACQYTTPDVSIDGFNAYRWKRDKFGCSNLRAGMVNNILAEQEQLLNLTEKEIIGLFGKPDGQELYGRGQKFLIYLTQPNIRCRAKTYRAAERPEKAQSLYIRLDALGRTNEIFIEQF